jgi:hypothetical protein
VLVQQRNRLLKSSANWPGDGLRHGAFTDQVH